MTITGAAEIAGVIGWPIDHSLSPLIHQSWIETHGLNAAYVPLKARAEDFAKIVEGVRAAGFKGLNVTVPHKRTAFALADRRDMAAEIAGAANLLRFGEGVVEAANTDQLGLIAALNEAMGEAVLFGAKAVIWGAGGMARAAVCGLATMGVKDIALVARRAGQADAMAKELSKNIAAAITVHDFNGWESAAESAKLLVNATSAGMNGLPSIDLPLDPLPPDAAVFDAVYHPLETELLRAAKASRRLAIDGLGMLLHQAVPSFEAFFGIRPQVTKELREKTIRALDAA